MLHATSLEIIQVVYILLFATNTLKFKNITPLVHLKSK